MSTLLKKVCWAIIRVFGIGVEVGTIFLRLGVIVFISIAVFLVFVSIFIFTVIVSWIFRVLGLWTWIYPYFSSISYLSYSSFGLLLKTSTNFDPIFSFSCPLTWILISKLTHFAVVLPPRLEN